MIFIYLVILMFCLMVICNCNGDLMVINDDLMVIYWIPLVISHSCNRLHVSNRYFSTVRRSAAFFRNQHSRCYTPGSCYRVSDGETWPMRSQLILW